MNIGKLDSRIDIYKMKEEDNELNENQPVPVHLKSVWANVETRTGSLVTGRPVGTMLSKTTHAITVRSESVKDITTDCFIMWTDANRIAHRFDIDYIIPPVRTKPTTSIYVQEVI